MWIVTFAVIICVSIIISSVAYQILEHNYGRFLNSSQLVMSTICYTLVLELYLVFLIYVISVDVYNSNNVSITTFIVSLSTLIFQQLLPKAFSYVVLSNENVNLSYYEKVIDKLNDLVNEANKKICSVYNKNESIYISEIQIDSYLINKVELLYKFDNTLNKLNKLLDKLNTNDKNTKRFYKKIEKKLKRQTNVLIK